MGNVLTHQLDDDEAREAFVQALAMLGAANEDSLQSITRIAQRCLGVPKVMVNLVGATSVVPQACVAASLDAMPRSRTFCDETVRRDELLVVEDTAADAYFASFPLSQGDQPVRFYAGHPLRVANGVTVGTLCLLDDKPRRFPIEDKALLRDLASLVESEIRAYQLAAVDPLTGLLNRRGFELLAVSVMHLGVRHGFEMQLAYIDLNEFKPINDRFGHEEGDHALRRFATALRGTCRESDILCRLGGDEFCVLLVKANPEQALGVFDRLRTKLQPKEGDRYALGFSVGTVTYQPEAHPNVGALLSAADTLMYAAKRQRRHT
jgi:diguanylate cyclase (GGDEF)-like protein